MAEAWVDVNYQGRFVAHPFAYADGKQHLFKDHDFAGMDFKGCVQFLKSFTGEQCVKLYYCMPGEKLRDGLRLMNNESHYQEFLAIAYECGAAVDVFMDHFGANVVDMIEEEVQEMQNAEAENAEESCGSN